jgi:hypothetical protein
MPASGSREDSEETSTDETDEGSGEKQAGNKDQGTEHDGQHTCAENLVLALGELNTHAKLPGAQAIGAAVTVHNVPPPLRLFRGIAVNAKSGALRTKPSTSGDDSTFVRLRAEHDLVIVMSACIEGHSASQASDVNKIEAHFFVEDPQESATKQRNRENKIQKSSAPTKRSVAAPKIIKTSSKASPVSTPPITRPDANRPPKTTSPTGPAKLAAGSNRASVSKVEKLASADENKSLGNKSQSARGTGQGSEVQQNGKVESASPDGKKERKKPRKLVRKEA